MGGETPLSIAVEIKRPDMIRLLGGEGAEPSIINNHTRTALMRAAWNRDTEAATLLLEMGASINQQTQQGETALTHSVESGNSGMVAFLLDNGAEINHRTQMGETALMRAVEKEHAEIAGILLDKGADSSMRTSQGKTVLVRAVEKENYELLKLLLRKGVAVNQPTKWGSTALMRAAGMGNYEITKMLLEKGADPNIISQAGKTALMWAVNSGHHEIAKLLMDKGADPDTPNHQGKTVKLRATESGKESIAAMLEAEKYNISPDEMKKMVKACQQGNTDRIHQFLRLGKPVDRALNGKTLLMIAAEHGQLDALRMLLRRGAILERRGPDGETALSKAAKVGQLGTLSELLKEGAQVTHQDFINLLKCIDKPQHHTPKRNNANFSVLSRAAADGDLDQIRGQFGHVKTGMDNYNLVNQLDGQGLTPLMQAAKYGRTDAVKLLLDYGADISHQDRRGETALSKAARHGQNKALELLLVRGADVTPKDMKLFIRSLGVLPKLPSWESAGWAGLLLGGYSQSWAAFAGVGMLAGLRYFFKKPAAQRNSLEVMTKTLDANRSSTRSGHSDTNSVANFNKGTRQSVEIPESQTNRRLSSDSNMVQVPHTESFRRFFSNTSREDRIPKFDVEPSVEAGQPLIHSHAAPDADFNRGTRQSVEIPESQTNSKLSTDSDMIQASRTESFRRSFSNISREDRMPKFDVEPSVEAGQPLIHSHAAPDADFNRGTRQSVEIPENQTNRKLSSDSDMNQAPHTESFRRSFSNISRNRFPELDLELSVKARQSTTQLFNPTGSDVGYDDQSYGSAKYDDYSS